MITDKEQALLKDIAGQMVLTFKAKGITEPTPEQISEAFIAQCKRNIELGEMTVYGVNVETGRCRQEEKQAIASGLARVVYEKIKGEQQCQR